jgi:hypothetical protein
MGMAATTEQATVSSQAGSRTQRWKDWSWTTAEDQTADDVPRAAIDEVLTYGDLAQVCGDNFTTKLPGVPVDRAIELPPAYGRPRYYADEGLGFGAKALDICLEASKTDAVKYKGIHTDLYAYSGWTNLLAPNKAKASTQILPAGPEDKGWPAWIGYTACKTSPGERDEIVFAWRGTTLLTEWMSNALIQEELVSVDCNGEQVGIHQGFWRMYTMKVDAENGWPPAQVIEEILDTYIKRGSKMPRFVTTGHSLGGALATVCAFHVAKYLNDNKVDKADIDVTAVTFSSPRVGNELFCKEMEELGVKALRVLNKDDFVPQVPLEYSPFSRSSREAVDRLESIVEEHLTKGLAEEEGSAKARATGQRVLVKLIDKLTDAVELVPSFKKTGPKRFQHYGSVLQIDTDAATATSGETLWQCDNSTFLAILSSLHNLETLLHMVGKVADDPVNRDPALLNKTAKLLAENWAEKYKIPPKWWAPEYTPLGFRHHGLQLDSDKNYRVPDSKAGV